MDCTGKKQTRTCRKELERSTHAISNQAIAQSVIIANVDKCIYSPRKTHFFSHDNNTSMLVAVD